MKIKTFFLVGIGATLLFAAGGDSLTDPAVERNDPGSGTGTLDIRADVDAFDEAGGLFTEFSVQVRDGIDSGPAICRTGPLSWAHTTARLQSETERSLADEAQGPLAQLLAIPQDGGDDSETDPLAALKADIRTARGKALLLETTAAGFGEGRSAAPRRDWMASRLGPHPPESMAQVQKQSFEAVLAATGTQGRPGARERGKDTRLGRRRPHGQRCEGSPDCAGSRQRFPPTGRSRVLPDCPTRLRLPRRNRARS